MSFWSKLKTREEKMANFEELKGKVLTEIIINADKDELTFKTNEGEHYRLHHVQDCCESVTIEDVCGDFNDLINTPILLAEEVVHDNGVNPKGVEVPEYQDSFTWTFYKLSSINGSVTIRWYGESNGYYSENVDFVKD
jgi:hypothetical protein